MSNLNVQQELLCVLRATEEDQHELFKAHGEESAGSVLVRKHAPKLARGQRDRLADVLCALEHVLTYMCEGPSDVIHTCVVGRQQKYMRKQEMSEGGESWFENRGRTSTMSCMFGAKKGMSRSSCVSNNDTRAWCAKMRQK